LGRFRSRREISFLAGNIEAGEAAPQRHRNIFVNRAGMRFLFFYAILRKHIEDDVRFYLKLTGQLVDTNLTHRKSNKGEACRFSAT